MQLEVEAEINTRVSIQRAQVFVNVTVTRNENGPVFSTSNYVENVQDTASIGSIALTLFAIDADGVSDDDGLLCVVCVWGGVVGWGGWVR